MHFYLEISNYLVIRKDGKNINMIVTDFMTVLMRTVVLDCAGDGILEEGGGGQKHTHLLLLYPLRRLFNTACTFTFMSKLFPSFPSQS